ncbi:MAG: zinc ribbon domain-containing protein [Oscillospiraceae bacterium]|nr:zinc ribbon domain-containing protein [Oscillospiraceae bacterium]
MYCPACGYSIDDNHKFCANCGVAAELPSDSNNLDSNNSDLGEEPQKEPQNEIGVNDLIESFEELDELEKLDVLPSSLESEAATYDESRPPYTSPMPSESVPQYRPPTSGYSSAPVLPQSLPVPSQEKFFFGKGALVFCLILIGILSVTSAMFMGLYLREIGAIL